MSSANPHLSEGNLHRSHWVPVAGAARAPHGEGERAGESAAEASARYVDEPDWLAMFEQHRRLPWHAVDLNRQGERLKTADGFNIPKKHDPLLWQWNPGDATTLKWRPQGITGSREASSPERPRWLAVSWYGRKEEGNAQRGARLSLVDFERSSPSFLKYRHVLLVQDAANIDDPELFRLPPDAPRYEQLEGYAPVPIHAGGVAWVGERLYVADTTLGLRVFDLTRLYAAQADPTKSRCGSDGGRLYAFNYGYVLPQVGYYRLEGTAPTSFVSLGTGGRGPCLWTGQYLKKAGNAGRTPKLFGWSLRQDGHIDTSRPAEEVVPNDSGGRAYNMQGAYRAGGVTWLSVTGRSLYQGSTARLVSQPANGEGLRWRWPHGAEDLYLEADTERLWCVTEFSATESRGARFVFAVSLPTYAPELHRSAPR